MNYFYLPKLLIFSAALLIGYSSFSQAVYVDSSGTTPKYKKAKNPGGRMTDFLSAMEFEFNMIKNPATGKIPEGSFTQELEQAKAILADQQKNNISNVGTPYAFQGPNNLGGRTRTIAYDVRYNGTTNRIILAGGVSGGVFKSIDDGATWVRKSPTAAHFSCTSIAQDTRPGFEDTWYYGVGESSGNSASFSGATYFGNGVYKSTDNGETWARLTTSNTSALESFSTGADAIQKVIVDPTDGYVYVACLAKIMRSIDGGTTWVDVLPGVLGFSSQTTDIVVSATGRLYASFGGTNDSGVDGVWASPPGATSGDPGSWTRIAGAGAGGSPVGWNFEAPAGTPGGYGRVVLAIPPSAPTLLYALYWNNVSFTCGAPAPEAELFRWDDVAATWTNLSATLPDEAGCSAGNDPFAVQGGYDLVIAVKPDAAGTLFIGGTNAYRSTDAGLTWTRIGGYAGTANYALYASSHPDIHAFVFQPGSPLIMLCANDGGIQRTTDNLAGTVAWTQINTGYRTYQYYHVTVDPRVGNTKVMGGTQDNGTSRNVGGVGTTHESIFGGDGVSVGLSDLIGGIQYEYVGFQFGEIFRRDATLGAGFGTYIIPPGESGTGLFVTLFKLDVDNSEILYYANDNKLYRTTSASTVTSGTWTDMTGIGTGVGASNDITAIATTRGIYSAATASLFLGTSNGKVYRLNDPAGVAAGTGPVDITGAGFPATGYVSSIAVNPRNDDTVLVTFSNYGLTSVFWTGTANSAVPVWTAVEGALTLPSYRSSAIAVTTAGVEYFVGTSTGLYTSMGLPGAVAWTQEGATEIGNAVVSSLALRASDGKLLVGTHGYGMWETTLTTGAACTITLTSAPGTNAQTVCINTAITNITYSTTDATGATFSGLPAGVTGGWAANVVTISGTPTAAGTFNYTVTLTGGSCVAVTATGSITVTPNNTVTLTSAPGTNTQTRCVNAAITNITYSTTGATGATFSGLPAGVTGNWAANVVTISGAPTTAVGSPFNYTVTLTGGCGSITATGTITVNPLPVVTNPGVTTGSVGTAFSQTFTASAGTPAYTFTTVSTLPAGIILSPAGVLSGTPTASGTFPIVVTATDANTCAGNGATYTLVITPATLETWELSTQAGSQASNAPTTTATNITAGILQRGAGVTATAAGGSISSNGWFNTAAATTLAQAITNNEYYEFTLPVNAGFTANVTGIALYLRSSATGPNTATLRSSADAYATDLGTASAIPNSAASLYNLPLTFTNISGTLTFRLYGYGGASGGGTPGTAGTMRIGTSPTALENDLDIYGTTATSSCSITLTSAPGTNAQTVCINTAITNITYSTTDATGATFSGLPAGVTGNWAANVVTISGTPTTTVGSPFNYTVTLTGGSCVAVTATGTITVTPNNTVTLTSAAGTNAQTVCINTAITNITYSTTGATGATFSGLPAGVTGNWAANVATISGTPTASGTFNYTVTLTGGCGAITATGTITVTPNNTIILTSAPGTNNQTVPVNTAITNITYSTTGATGATFSGLPAGVTGGWAANVVTISGTPTTTVGSPFNYTITLTGGCGTITATGTITVTGGTCTITLTSAPGTNAQTVCINTAITNITYSTTDATGATFSGLPAGVTGNWAANVVTISGTPTTTVGSPFNYTVTLTGGSCVAVTATGTITVTPNNTVTLTSAAGTNAQTVCINTAITNITYSTTGATGATFSGLPAGVTGNWAANVATISGTPTASGTFNYTVTLTGGCGAITATGSITVTPNNTITLTSAAGTNAQTVCINTAITNITYSTTGATGATFSGLPAGVTGNWAANVVTISGSPTTTVGSPFSYTVTLTGGCGSITATGSITVTPNNTVTLTSAPGTNNQTVPVNTAITNITYSTTGATGATFSGLPAGVTGGWAANVVTISGTPTTTVGSPFNYTVTLTGGCGTITATGTITVTGSACTITLTSAPGTNAQTVCINTAITNITYSTTDATGATFSGLPAGVTGVWVANVVTISGTPTAAGTFNYTVTLTGGSCVAVTATGSITVTPNNTVTLTSAPGTNAQTVCINTAIINITYSTTTATGATFSGLPAGVTGIWAANVATISGTPTAAGTFNYTVTLTGGCGVITATGSITVTATPNATIVYTGSPYCTIAGTATVTQTGTAGGTYSSTAGLTLNPATGAVTLATSTPATYTVTYTIPAAGGCPVYTTTASITIINCAVPCVETFDGVTPPAFPVGWFTTTGGGSCGASTPWRTTNTASSSAPNAAFTNDPNCVSDEYLDTRTYTPVAAGSNRLFFRNNYTLESTYDGMVLEISINGGAFADIITAGGSFVTGGYNGTISTLFGSPIGGRQAWTGSSGGFITSSVNLPASANGQNVVFRFRRATDNSVSSTGVYVDDVYVIQTATISYAGSPYCSNAGTATVTRTGTAGGTYSAAPAGLTLNAANGDVTLSTSTPGTYTVTYTIAASGGCPVVTATTSITITALPAATIVYAGSPYCTTSGTATVTRTGTAGGTYSAAPAGLTLNAANGDVTLGTSTPGTYTVTYTIAAGGGCPVVTATTSITVTAANAATISYAGTPYCTTVTSAPVTRTGTAGGTYSAAPAGLTINASTGTVNPSTSTPGTYTVTYTMAATGGCPAATATTTITITLAPNMIIVYLGTPYCSNAGTATVSQFGTTGGTYTAAPAGLTINATTGSVTLGTSTPGTYTVTYSVAAPGCGITFTTTTITITAAPNATISYAGSPYCSNAGTANVTLTGTPSGGVYSSTAGLSLNAATGAVNLAASTAGTYTVTYTVAASGGCALYTTTTTISITTLPAATISYTGSPYCSNAGTATVTRTGTAGGTYTAAPAGLSINAATGAVNLAASTAGTYTVTYTIAAGGGCPAVTATASITITAVPAATISYAGNPFCQPGGIASVTRTGTAGGTYSAAPAGLIINATTGDINVTTSTPGTYTVTYALAAGGGCPVVNATTSVTVNSPSVAPTAANATSTSLCTPGTVTLSVTGGSLGSGATWRWYSGSCGGTLVGTGATLIVTVNTTTTYFVRAEGPCNTTTCASVTVAVNVQPTISIAAAPRTTLLPGQTTTLTATVTPATGNTFIWYRNGVVVPGATGATLVVTVDGFGTYTARVTTAAGCTALSNAVTIIAEISTLVFVYPNPNAGQFQVRVYNPLGKPLTVMVHNARAQLVYRKNMVTSAPYTRMDVDLRNVADGDYLVSVVDGDGQIIGTRKVLIAK